ncbi:MAG: hypothetical protein JKY22_02750 [Flavobacteriaceae bacterium]|nr:hypothetical protein [Flavobacteriaceae bacterium]
MNLYAQEGDAKKEEKAAEEEKKKAKKSLKEILSFKNFLHHSDSSRLAKRYIRWHKKLTRNGEDYRFTIYKDELSDSLPYIRKNKNNLLSRNVFGWYPYWEKDLYKTLDYSLLSTIAYFSYEVDPKTGDSITANMWMKTKLIDTIKARNKDTIKNYPEIKILLTVSNFGNENNKTFLKNARAGDTLIKRVIQLLDARGGHGVCIDFEGIVNSQKTNYKSFIIALSQELKKKDYLLYMTVPAVDWHRHLQYDDLIPIVDQFIIMGYNYYGATSKVAGPVAPLKSGKIWDPFNLTTSVDYYLANDIPSNKLILALPFYGHIWQTKTGQKGSRIDHYVGARSIDYIKSVFDNEPSIKQQYDSVSQSAYYTYVEGNTKRNKRQFRQLWFDSDSALAKKLELIKDRNLTGVGIWALGYNKRYDDYYWSIIEDSFCLPADTINDTRYNIRYPDTIVVFFQDSTQIVEGHTHPEDCKDPPCNKAAAEIVDTPTFWDKLADINEELKRISGLDNLLLFILAFVVLFGGIGFVIAMFKPDTRMFFFNSKAYTIYFTVILSVFLIVVMQGFLIMKDPATILLLGFVVGAIIVYLVSRYVQKVKRNLP